MIAVITVAAGVALASQDCAARGARNRAQVGSLAVGEAALALDRAERTLYAANVPGYDKAAHDRVGENVIKVLYAARGYERAAKDWPTGGAQPAALTQAQAAITTALEDLVKALPAIAAVRDPLNRAIAGIRAALEMPSSAEIPTGGVVAAAALLAMISQLLASGTTTLERLRAIFKQEGATPEQLATLDAALSSAITNREADTAARPT